MGWQWHWKENYWVEYPHEAQGLLEQANKDQTTVVQWDTFSSLLKLIVLDGV
jgi:hypothetical protein